MKKIQFLTVLMLLSGGTLLAQPLDSLFNKYAAATGGEKLYDNIESYTLNWSSDDSKVPYEQTLMVSQKTKKALKVRDVLGRKFMYKLDGSNGTLYIPIGGLNRASSYQTQGLSDFEKSKLSEELNGGLFAFMDYKAKGYSAKMKGNMKLGVINAVQVELSNTSITRNFYFDVASGLLIKEDWTYANGEKTELQYSAFKITPYGIKYPSKGVLIEAGKTKTIDIALTINDLSPASFEIK